MFFLFLILYPTQKQNVAVSVKSAEIITLDEVKNNSNDYDVTKRIQKFASNPKYKAIKIQFSFINLGKKDPVYIMRAKIRFSGNTIIYNKRNYNVTGIQPLKVSKVKKSDSRYMIILIKDSEKLFDEMTNEKLVEYLSNNLNVTVYSVIDLGFPLHPSE